MKQGWILLASMFVLSACASGEVRDTLGLSKRAPDEFVVVSRPALTVPPDFTLVAPDPSKRGPQLSTEEQARSALIGDRAPAPAKGSILGGASGARASKLGGDDAGWNSLLDDGDLPSDKLTSEFSLQSDGAMARRTAPAAVISVESSSMGTAAESNFLNRMGASKADPEIRSKLSEDEATEPANKAEAASLYESVIGADKEQPVVDAKKEAERLRKNKDDGKKPNEGEVPTDAEAKKSRSVLDTIF